MQLAKEFRIEGASKRDKTYWEHSRFTVFRLLILLIVRNKGRVTSTQVAHHLTKYIGISAKDILDRGNICNMLRNFWDDGLIDRFDSPEPFNSYVLTKKGRELINSMLTLIESVELSELEEEQF